MKIYLAGPMRGIPEFNFPEFHRYAALLRNDGHEVFSPAEKGEEVLVQTDPHLQDNLDFRRKVFLLDTAFICREAEAIAMMPGWERSVGARAEWQLAQAIGIKVVYLQ